MRLFKTSAASMQFPTLDSRSGFLIRGFENYKYYLDGVRVDNFTTQISEETADIQQIEVLKGPASILYGRISARRTDRTHHQEAARYALQLRSAANRIL